MANRTIVVLERVRPGQMPDYCVHGQVTCIRCGHWCWLGSETYGPVSSRSVDPLCLDCSYEIVPKGTPLKGRLNDHRRADGPHE